MRRCCEDENYARRKHGSACAKLIKQRISDLRAIEVVTDIEVGNPHRLTKDRKGQFALTLTKAKRLVFEPAGESDSNVETDWTSVSSIRIVFIGDYHA